VKGLVAGLPGPDKHHKEAVLPAFYRRAAGVGLASYFDLKKSGRGGG